MEIKKGDTITFKSPTRWSYAKAKRKIKGFDDLGRPLVGYGGRTNFIVQFGEILEVNGEEFSV